MRTTTRIRAFAMVEAAVVGAVLAAACCLGAVAARQHRHSAGLAGSMANLQRIGEVTGNYAADYDDCFWTFSWKAGDSFSQWNELNDAETDLEATANQAIDIMRRRYGQAPRSWNNWIAHPRYSTLVLAEYLDEPLPMEWVASPGDWFLLAWQQYGDWEELRRACMSSYELPTAFVSPDEYPTITQSPLWHRSYEVPYGLELGGRRVREVDFSSAKVHLSDRASWYFGPRPAWYLCPEARVPHLMVDGSVTVRTTADANAAWNPKHPADDDYWISYKPDYSGEVRPLDPAGDRVSGKYRWTRRGLQGVDFNGESVE